ncbi:MAG: ribonuclease H-like domain-containing protein [Sandaracinaceae bacterium]|nr:ribonuclease H-like domain-containing protein [Sandaracinaceae bacterium]
MDRPVIAFDIETIPDPAIGRRRDGLVGTDEEVVREMVRRRVEETEGGSEYPQLPWQRVVCVCVTILDTQGCEIRHLGGAPLDERSHVEALYRLVGERAPLLVSWNGRAFDLPVLRYRALALGVAAPGFYHRKEELHVDLMYELSSHGQTRRTGLRTISELLDLPAKRFADKPVWEHVIAGQIDRVVEYCKLDTVDTLLVYLAWAHHEGRLDTHALVAAVERVRAAVTRESDEGWRPIEAALERWPAWAR